MTLPLPPARETILYEWVRLLFGILRREGLEHAVICPGSRNSPLIYGALAEPDLQCYSVIDERSAGFFALGLARATRVPVALICTSGTALAHFLPAVIEAHHSSIPLLILSADRPEYLQNCGSAQTIHQVGIFGSFAHSEAGWDEPSGEQHDLEQFSNKLSRLMRVTRGALPGPAHLNLAFDKPLEPRAAAGPCAVHQRVDQILAEHRPSERAEAQLDQGLVLELLQGFIESPGYHVVALGPVEPHLVPVGVELARKLVAALVCELPDTRSSVDLDALVRRFSRADSDEKLNILHLGPPMISSQWAELLKTKHVRHWVVCGPRYLEPSKTAQAVLQVDVKAATLAMLAHLNQPNALLSRAGWRTFESETYDPSPALNALGKRSLSQRMAEPWAALTILNAAHEAEQLFLGNSLSVRLAAWTKDAALGTKRAVYTSRGTNGIDGLIAQGAGLARAHGKSTLVLLGDVAAAHDLTSLALLRHSTTPIVVVVLENQGGMIFQHLPGAAMWNEVPKAKAFFTTPPEIDWQAAGQTYGILVWDCSTLEELASAIELTCERPGPSLVIARTDSSTTQLFLRHLRGESRQ